MSAKIFLQFGLIIVATFAAQGIHAEPSKAVMNSDYVRVRENPVKDAAPLGFLYKNMLVEILSQTADQEKIGNDRFYWYEVKSEDLHGWVYGKFLSPNITNQNIDTYDAPGDTQWLTDRFGDSTWYYNQKMDMRSFSMDDYRNLMRAAEMGNEQAWIALRITIINHLHENPNDTDYAYLKKRLYSVPFLKAVMSQPYADPNYGRDFFDLVPYSRELVAATVGDHPAIAGSMPEEYWSNKEIVRQVVHGQDGCSYLSKIPDDLMRDPEIKVGFTRCKAGQ